MSDLRLIERVVKKKRTPLLVVDRGVVRQKFRELQESIGNAKICYALKTNSHWRIIELLQELGSDFEISSQGELGLLLRRGIPPQRIISSNPVKTETFIKAAFRAGINLFAFDSYDELEKLARFASGSKVYVRLTVSNDGSQWPLIRKFGVETEDAVALLEEAQKKQLIPYGITFHVGSQCIDPETWVKAIEKSKMVWDSAKDRGIELRMLNLGGGFPINYGDSTLSIGEIAEHVKDTINRLFPEDIEIFVEPGRVLVGEAGTLVTTVIGKAMRNGEKWLYLDVGVFNGLMESIGGIKYPMTFSRNGSLQPCVLAGPSCDSVDIIQNDILLPELEVGDNVYILSAGAYTTAYASRFDGFTIPQTVLL
ncbi:type III PLP-dependent enzyme [Chloroflexota bacterium]